MRATIAILAAVAFAASAAEPPIIKVQLKAEQPAGPDIRLPAASVTPASPTLSTPLKVTDKFQYVFDAMIPVVVLTSPSGLVTITSEPGPLKVKGYWADKPSDTKATTRNFSGKYVYTVEPKMTGRVELIVIPHGVTDESKIVRRTIDVDAGQAPQPPPFVPTPVVPPTPDPVPPSPVTQSGAWVVIVADEANPSVALGQIVDGPTLRSLKAAGKCRVYGSLAEADKIKAKKYDVLMAESKLTGSALLVLDSSGHGIYAGPLPLDEATLAKTIKENMKP